MCTVFKLLFPNYVSNHDESKRKQLKLLIFNHIGNGVAFILSLSSGKRLEIIWQEVATDVLTDLAFHPSNAGSFVTSGGNGQLIIHERGSIKKTKLFAHSAEISSIEWINDCIMLTASWDGSVKMVRFEFS